MGSWGLGCRGMTAWLFKSDLSRTVVASAADEEAQASIFYWEVPHPICCPIAQIIEPVFDGILADLESAPSNKRPTLIGMADWPARLKGHLSRWPRRNVP
jgi:hypothetical protein